MKTTISLFAVLVFALFAFSPIAAIADTTENAFAITDVNYDDTIAPGSALPIDVEMTNSNTAQAFEDVNLKAWVVDSWGDRITDKAVVGPIKVFADQDKTLTINLNIPADVNPGMYKVVVQADGIWEKGVHRITVEPANADDLMLQVEQSEDAFFVQDIRTSQTGYSAGSNVDVALTVMNNGADDQDNVVVSLAIPALDVQKSLKIFGTLFAGNSQTVYMTFALPKDADGGIYTMTATAGNTLSKYSTSTNLIIKEPIKISSSDTSIKNTKVPMNLEVGKAQSIQLAISNKDSVSKTYEITSDGNDWATITATPVKFDLRPGQTQTVTIAVTADKTGANTANIVVLENSKAISSVVIEANAKTSITTIGAIIATLAIILAAIVVYFNFSKNGGSKQQATKHVYY